MTLKERYSAWKKANYHFSALFAAGNPPLASPVPKRGIPLTSRDFNRGILNGTIDIGGNLGKITPEEALRYDPVNVCVSVIAEHGAQVLDTIHVVDGNQIPVSNRNIDDLVRMLREGPDGGDGNSFWEQVLFDQELHGNALLLANKPLGKAGDIPTVLLRLNPVGAEFDYNNDVYRASVADMPDSEKQEFPSNRVIHIRKGRRNEYNRDSNVFAVSPISLLSETIRTGILVDSYIQGQLDDGLKSRVIIALKGGFGETPASKEQMDELAEQFELTQKTGYPIVIPEDAAVSEIQDDASNQQLEQLADRLARRVSAAYGFIPPSQIGGRPAAPRGVDAEARRLWKYAVGRSVRRTLSVLSDRILYRGYRFKVETSAFLRGDAKEITGIINVLRHNTGKSRPLATENEIRTKLLEWAPLTEEQKRELDAEMEAYGNRSNNNSNSGQSDMGGESAEELDNER